MKDFKTDLLQLLYESNNKSLDIADIVHRYQTEGYTNFQMKETLSELKGKGYISLRTKSIGAQSYEMQFSLAQEDPIDGSLYAGLTSKGREYVEEHNRRNQPPPPPEV